MKVTLLIEDDEDTQMMIKYILEDEGYQVVSRSDIISVEQVIGIDPDIILIDHLLRSGFGGKLCSELKANPLTDSIPIVLMSVHPQIASVAEVNCADTYIAKPFNIDDLINTVRLFDRDGVVA